MYKSWSMTNSILHNFVQSSMLILFFHTCFIRNYIQAGGIMYVRRSWEMSKKDVNLHKLLKVINTWCNTGCYPEIQIGVLTPNMGIYIQIF